MDDTYNYDCELLRKPANWIEIDTFFEQQRATLFKFGPTYNQIKNGAIVLPMTSMMLSNYGFDETYIVQFTGQKKRFILTLNEQSQRLYEQVCEAAEMPLLQFANVVAKIVNNSMAYEFPRVLNKHTIEGTAADIAYYMHAREKYIPPQNATMHGICSDAGYLIRQIIKNNGISYPNCWLTETSLKDISQPTLRTHDVTILFSDKNWIAINSLSPTNAAYILERKDLEGKLLTHNSSILEPRIMQL